MEWRIICRLTQLSLVLLTVSRAFGDLSATNWDIQPLVATSAHESDPVWSPDGQRIAYISDESGVRSVYIANSNGTEVTRVSSNADSVNGAVAWGPDGKTLFYSTDNVHRIDLNADRSAAVSDQLLTNDSFGWSTPHPSPDGSKLLVQHNWQLTPHGSWHATLWEMDATIGSSTLPREVGSGDMSEAPTWSPDGEQFFYAHHSWQEGPSDIWSVSDDVMTKILDRSQTRLHLSPACSPDGETLAFSYHTGGAGIYPYSINIVDVDGSDLFQLDPGPAAMTWQQYSWQADIWSSDGQSIVCMRKDSGFWNIYLIDALDGSTIQVTNTIGDDIGARLNAYNNIVFQTNRDGNWDIYLAQPVPAPAGLLLGLLGLASAGWKLRRCAQ